MLTDEVMELIDGPCGVYLGTRSPSSFLTLIVSGGFAAPRTVGSSPC